MMPPRKTPRKSVCMFTYKYINKQQKNKEEYVLMVNFDHQKENTGENGG